MKNKIKKLMLYGGITKEEYHMIRSSIWENNRQNLISYAIIAGGGMTIMFALSFFVDVLESSRVSYIAVILVCLMMILVSIGPAKKHEILTPLCVYLFNTLLLGFGIILGTVVEPNQASASFGILLFAIPLLFTDTPIITDCQMLLAIIVYIFAARATQNDIMYGFNMSFVMPYGIVGLILCALNMRVKITRQVLDHENKVLSERDQLTGLMNRRSFEQKLDQIRKGEKNRRVMFFEFDVNGLKKVNDTLGHQAGDELIRAAADCISSVFGRYGYCYRIGGDEFFVIIEGAAPGFKELSEELQKRSMAFHGVLVSGLSIAMGSSKCIDPSLVDSAVQEADKKMYANKEAYYKM